MITTKWCSKCEADLPVSDFYKNLARKDGLSTYCVTHHNLEIKNRQDRKKLLNADYCTRCKGILSDIKTRGVVPFEWCEKCRIETNSKYCLDCGKKKSLSDNFQLDYRYKDGYINICKSCMTIRTYKPRDNERLRALAVLGSQCKHCGIQDVRVLVIDHINGGGKADRATFKSPTSFYIHVSDFPKGYQCLCHNCNFLKRIENNEHRKPGPNHDRFKPPPKSKKKKPSKRIIPIEKLTKDRDYEEQGRKMKVWHDDPTNKATKEGIRAKVTKARTGRKLIDGHFVFPVK